MTYWITEHTVNVGIILGTLLGVCYLVRASYIGSKIQLTKFLETFLSSFALITSLKLLIKVFNSTTEYLGNLANDKEIIMLGSVSIIFLSLNSFVNILDLKLENLINRFNKNKNPSQDK
jgi:hypothetical protein